MPPRVVAGAVARAVEAIHQRPVVLDQCATAAKHVVSLQRATLTPWEQLADEIELVARWARDSHDHLAGNDIRGIDSRTGEAWNADRSYNVSTICVQARWSDRLEAARRWEAGTGPPAPRARGEHSSSRRPEPTAAELAAQDPHLWDPI